MAMSDVSRDFKRPSLDKTTFEGYVVDTNDPDKRQRVRVRIPVLHRGIPDDKLPWANIQSGATANAGGGVGTVHVPEKYSKVNINFLEDDPHNPQYSSSPASDDVNKENELLQEDYPDTYGSVDSYGNRVSVNRATGDYAILLHKSGTTITVDGAGNVNITSPTTINMVSGGDIRINAGGELRLHARGGDVNVAGSPNIQLNTNGPDSAMLPGSRSTPVIKDQSGKTEM